MQLARHAELWSVRACGREYGAAVVEVRSAEALLAWCREHDIGLAPATLEALVGPVREESGGRRLGRLLTLPRSAGRRARRCVGR